MQDIAFQSVSALVFPLLAVLVLKVSRARLTAARLVGASIAGELTRGVIAGLFLNGGDSQPHGGGLSSRLWLSLLAVSLGQGIAIGCGFALVRAFWHRARSHRATGLPPA